MPRARPWCQAKTIWSTRTNQHWSPAAISTTPLPAARPASSFVHSYSRTSPAGRAPHEADLEAHHPFAISPPPGRARSAPRTGVRVDERHGAVEPVARLLVDQLGPGGAQCGELRSMSSTSSATWCIPSPRLARKRPTGVSSPSGDSSSTRPPAPSAQAPPRARPAPRGAPRGLDLGAEELAGSARRPPRGRSPRRPRGGGRGRPIARAS